MISPSKDQSRGAALTPQNHSLRAAGVMAESIGQIALSSFINMTT
jgi:hypothetical protein